MVCIESDRVGQRRQYPVLTNYLPNIPISPSRGKSVGLPSKAINPTIFTKLPLASADSTNVARNMAYDCAWKGTYQPPTKAWRGIILAERIESQQSPQRWIGSTQLTIFPEDASPDYTEKLTLF